MAVFYGIMHCRKSGLWGEEEIDCVMIRFFECAPCSVMCFRKRRERTMIPMSLSALSRGNRWVVWSGCAVLWCVVLCVLCFML